MNTQPITVKMLPAALQHLRLIAARTGEKQYEVLSRVLAAENKRVSDIDNQEKVCK